MNNDDEPNANGDNPIMIAPGNEMQNNISFEQAVEAVKSDDVRNLQKFLRPGVNLEYTNEDCDTLLGCAASWGCIKALKLLILNKAKIEARGRFGQTPLHNAAIADQTECIEELLKCGADIEAKYEDGDTPLIVAACRGSKNAAKLLIQHKADIESKGLDGRTPLASAAFFGVTECVEELLKNGASIESSDIYGNTPLILASLQGHLNTVKALHAYNADVAAEGKLGQAALTTAAWLGHAECVEFLLSKGAKVNFIDSEGHTSLHLAVMHQHIKCVELLVVHPDTDLSRKTKKGKTALEIAKNLGFLEITKILENPKHFQRKIAQVNATPERATTSEGPKLTVPENPLPTADPPTCASKRYSHL